MIAVGQADGAIRIQDLRMDENIMQFSQTHGVTDLAFRMDGPAVLASSSTDGSISVWDLAKKRVAHTQRGAHDTGVAGMQWVQGQPLLITSGADNYVKVSYPRLSWPFLNQEVGELISSNGCSNPPMPSLDYSSSAVVTLPLPPSFATTVKTASRSSPPAGIALYGTHPSLGIPAALSCPRGPSSSGLTSWAWISPSSNCRRLQLWLAIRRAARIGMMS